MFIYLGMEANATDASKISRQRKNAVVLPQLVYLKSSNLNPSIKNVTTRPRTRSLNTPPTWHENPREKETNTEWLRKNNSASRKYSENMHTQRQKHGTYAIDTKSNEVFNIRGVGGRRRKSLADGDKRGIFIGNDDLIRHGGFCSSERALSATPFSDGSGPDDMTWSRYWHYARYLTKGTSYGMNDVDNDDGGAVRCPKMDFEQSLKKIGIEKVNNFHKETFVQEMQLSLEERLDKIEKERGF